MICPICHAPRGVSTGVRGGARLLKTCGADTCYRQYMAQKSTPRRTPDRSRASRERTRQALLARPGPTARCKRCDKPYRKNLAWKNYCSAQCQQRRRIPPGSPRTRHCTTCGVLVNATGRPGPLPRTCSPECARIDDRARSYGLDGATYKSRLADQGGECALGCGRTATDIDHDHETGVFRGILCKACNRTIGVLAETRIQRQRLFNYLEGE